MKIGHGWTKTTESGATCITIALDEVLGFMFPFLKIILEKCFITLWHIPKEERKDENSPSWSVNITVKREKKEKTEEEIDEAPF